MHLDRALRELVVDGRRTRLAEKPFRVLVALIDAQGAVVTREALRALLWSDDTFVDFDNNLNSTVATLRHALGDSAKTPRYIETIPKVGYRLVPPAAAHAGRTVRATRARRAVSVAASLALLIALASALHVWRTSAPGPAAGVPDVSREARAHFDRGVHLRGRFLATHDDPGLLVRARAAFDEALRIEPSFAAAAAERADTLVEMSFAGAVGFREGLDRARASARSALSLTRSSAPAARVMAITTLFLDWDFAASRAWLDRAGDETANAKAALARATWLAAAGRPDAAVAAAERAVALDPAAHYVHADLAMFYLAAGRHADAVESSRHVLAAAPGFTPAMHFGLLACEQLGRRDEAAAFARALLQARGASAGDLALIAHADPGEAVAFWRRWNLARLERQTAGRRGDHALQLGLRRAELGDRGGALDELELALHRRDPLLVFVRAFPELATLHGDPRFESIARAVTALQTA